MSEYSRDDVPRRSSISKDYLPTSDIIKKSIRRSWTISNPEDDSIQNEEAQQYSNLPRKPSQSSYPSLVRHPYINANVSMSDDFDDQLVQQSATRRMLRQSTLPNPDPNVCYGSNNNLMPPTVSPKPLSPQYSPYHTDNENEESDNPQATSPSTHFKIRRQSTLPCRPNEHHTPGGKYLSTSPNSRTNLYSRSPDKSDSDQPRYPPFIRQATFPSNASDPFHQLQAQQQRHLPTSPNRLMYNKSPDSGGESGEQQIPRRYQMMRQATLPNPDQHVKLLPTSPPKKQLSPHNIKRSPEFTRQNSLPAPDSMNSLTVHQHGSKFLPISPRQKQSFLFPQPTPVPRPFLSQQHFPTMADETSTPIQNPGTPTAGHHSSKMLKGRSHSNEEYSFSRIHPPQPQEGRRMLPEIPSNRSPKLVRQAHVKEELARTNSEKRSPKQKTFAEAKQTMMEEYDANGSKQNFDEDDEATFYDNEENYDIYNNDNNTQRIKNLVGVSTIKSAESFLNDSSPEYFYPDDYIRAVKKDRNRRRKSRDLPLEPEVIVSSNDEEPIRRKAETMRSISEETPGSKLIKPVTRRSLSHPEKNSEFFAQVQTQAKKNEPTKIPSPKPLTEILERQRKAVKFPSPRRKNYKSLDLVDNVSSVTTPPPVMGPKISAFQQVLQNQRLQKRDSKSFDTVAMKVISDNLKEQMDADKSKSLDDGIFSENKQPEDKEHKTTLGEAEIQSAVEAAAVVFKKVVLQRRQEKKDEEGDTYFGQHYHHHSLYGAVKKLSLLQDEFMVGSSSSEADSNQMKLLYPDSDDYKLVFISSDSSSKEEEYEDSSSTTSSIYTRHSIILDDCDWDYFEPGVTNTKSLFKDISVSASPFGSPNVYRKKFNLSPMTSPMLYRRGMSESPLSLRKRYGLRESETDETGSSSSPTRSESFLDQMHEYKFMRKLRHHKGCGCECGGQPHYVPIPVPVPIPVSLATFQNWTNQTECINDDEKLTIKQKQNDLIQQLLNISLEIPNSGNAVFMNHKIHENSDGQEEEEEEGVKERIKEEQVEKKSNNKKLFRNNDFESISCNGNNIFSSDLTVDQTVSQSHVVVPVEQKDDDNDPTVSDKSNGEALKEHTNTTSGEQIIVPKIQEKENYFYIQIDNPSCNAETNTDNDTRVSVSELNTEQTEYNLIKRNISIEQEVTSDSCATCRINNDENNMIRVGEMSAEKLGFVAGDDEPQGYLLSENIFSSSSSDSDTHEEDENSEKPVQRSYDVTDEAQEVSGSSEGYCYTSDFEPNSLRGDKSSSSSSEDTDSDDTGTVADRRPKSKRFTKVFVINKNSSNSDTDSSSSPISSDDDGETTSDNDTDIDRDCGIVLNYVKPISDDEQNEIKLNYVKQLPENNDALHNNDLKIELIEDKQAVDNENKSKLVIVDDHLVDLLNKMSDLNNESEPDCGDVTKMIISNDNDKNVDLQNDDRHDDGGDVNDGRKDAENESAMNLNVEAKDDDDYTLTSNITNIETDSLMLLDEEEVEEEEEEEKIKFSPQNNTNKAAAEQQPGVFDCVEKPTIDEPTCESNSTPQQQSDHEECSFVNERSLTTDVNNYNSAAIAAANNNKHKSLVMITQNHTRSPAPLGLHGESQVSVVATDTTRIVDDDDDDQSSVTVKHTNSNWINGDDNDDARNLEKNTLAGYFNYSLEQSSPRTRRQIKITTNHSAIEIENNSVNDSVSDLKDIVHKNIDNNFEANEVSESGNNSKNDDVTVVTGANTLSAVICMEDGLADDDSWVEEISHDEEEFATTTATESDIDDSGEELSLISNDREEELRGYNRSAIDFTLHTIVEESCEESEVEERRQKNRVSASELEKYFFYGLGDGAAMLNNVHNRDESVSESSSVCSEGLDSLGGPEENSNSLNESADLASSRLEKYFLTGFMGFSSERNDSDGSGSVGSDSEGHPSPEQRRKRLVRARGTGRSHSSSLDNLLAKEESEQIQSIDINESMDSSETDTCDETIVQIEKNESLYDTAKRKKKTKKTDPDDMKKSHETLTALDNKASDETDEEERKTPQPDFSLSLNPLSQSKKQSSRDSGFIGSNDDLLKGDEAIKSPELKIELEEIEEENKSDLKEAENSQNKSSGPPSTSLTRKDSFNNWSSDEETNLMMSKMRQFFKTLVAASANAQNNKTANSKNSTPVVSESNSPKTGTPVPRARSRSKPPQLVYFENELTRLMKTVPGIREDQVREIVEYLSSEDTWSDSYDSSDYTSSDLEGAVVQKSELQEQISASCQQIINKFDILEKDEEGDIGDGGLIEEPHALNKETAFVYQKLVASLTKMANSEEKPVNITNSPPLIAKVMHHIGSRLVALMHEVSSGESHASSSPKSASRYHKRLQQKISVTTTEDDDSTSDSNLEKNEDIGYLLPRSKSHDLLLGDPRPHYHQSGSGDIVGEEKEASDYERFSWRGSFESALLANGDSRTKLSIHDSSSSASVLAAKRRSAGDLLFNHQSLSREQLDRVRSCGSIGGGDHGDFESSKMWGSSQSQHSSRRRSSAPDETDSDDSTMNDNRLASRSTLPRSLQTTTSAVTTNSLPRLPTSNIQTILSSAPSTSSSTSSVMQKSQSVYHFLQNNVKSARYRAPGFNRPPSAPKRAVSAPGLQPLYPRRERRRVQSSYNEEATAAEAGNSPLIGGPNRNGATSSSTDIPANVRSIATSPIASPGSDTSHVLPSQSEEDIDRLVAMHQNRHSLSSLGLRSDSMASVYSGAGEGRYGTVTVRGQIEFGMQYNYKQGALEIHIKQCKDLAAVDAKRNRSDPYVKVYLLPDKSKSGKRKTKVKKHTLNPVFDECLRFHMSINSLESRTLWLTVWHSDMFGRNDFLGEVTMGLQDKVFDNPTPQCYQLQERSEPFDDPSTYKGDIIVGLKFIPPDSGNTTPQHHNGGGTNTLRKFSTKSINTSSLTSGPHKGALHVLVKEAKNLQAVKANGTCDAFCKSYLLPDKNRSSKQKTPVVKRSTSPTWNYTFIYDDVSLSELSERALELTIWDHDRLASNEFLGGVRFSLGTGKHQGRVVDWMDATGKELSLWQSMLNRPNFWVEGCLVLRSSLDNIKFSS